MTPFAPALPSVSVVLPVRNGAEFLDEALGSLRGQTLTSLEIVAIDDGSVDATPAILRRHADEDARIRILRPDGMGIVAALNAGLAAARAEFVARMDADDVAVPKRLELQLAHLQSRRNVAAVGSAIELVDRMGRSLRVERYPLGAADVRRTLLERCCLAHPSVMVVRDAVLSLGGYRAAFVGCEDYDLWLRLSEVHDIENLAQPLLRYRVHPGQSAWQASEGKFVAECVARHAARQRRSGAGEPAAVDAPGDRQTLVDLGWSPARVGHELFDYAMGVARRAETFRDFGAAAAALRLAAQQTDTPWRWRLRRALLAIRVRMRVQFGAQAMSSTSSATARHERR